MISLRNAVERLGASSADPYVCRTCDDRFEVQHHVCPSCGGFSVEAAFDTYGGGGG